jgi:hypothetical protein
LVYKNGFWNAFKQNFSMGIPDYEILKSMILKEGNLHMAGIGAGG